MTATGECTTVCRSLRPVDEGRTPQLVIVRAKESDVRWIARQHRASLPPSFFASLGEPFLRVYYRGFLASPHATLLLAQRRGPAGFLAGTTDDVAHVRWITRRWWPRLLLSGVAALVTRPNVLMHFMKTRARRYVLALLRLRRATAGRDGDAPRLGEPGRAATLTHIAVTSEARQAGVGQALVEAYLELCRDSCADRVTAVTRAGEEGADGFYERLRWSACGGSRDIDGHEFHRWRCDL